MRFPDDEIRTRTVRFRTLGCWPVTGAVECEATDVAAVVDETLRASSSERQGRISDGEDGGSLEQKKRERNERPRRLLSTRAIRSATFLTLCWSSALKPNLRCSGLSFPMEGLPVADLQPANALAGTTAKPYPNDSAEYRAARTALLAEEIELRRHIERVAKLRRALPNGGAAPPYQFIDEQGNSGGLAEMFGQHDTLVTYFWMFGPERERPCPMCTSLLGSLDIPAIDLEQRLALAVIGRSPVARQVAFARERGWRNLKFYQCVGDDFPTDYRGLDPDGNEWASLDVWTKKDAEVRHFWAAESGGTADPGQDAHLAPDPAPLWTILDLSPGGRGTNWYPKLDYGQP